MFRENKKHLQPAMLSSIDALPQRQLKRLGESWAGVFYRETFSRLDEKPFAVLYSDKDSRPNVPVNILVGLETLKSGFNWSDEEMYDAFTFDVQVRYALGYRILGEGDFELRSVYNFRHRLAEHMQKTGENLIEKSFEQITDKQIASYQLKTAKVRMDSSQIASNIANLSRLHLLVEVLGRVHQMLGDEDRAAYEEAFAPYVRGTSGQYVYRVKGEDGATHMQQIGELMGRLLLELADAYGQHPTYQMLKRVFSEHFVVEQGRLRLKVGKELSTSSLNSPDDWEATFRTKANRSYKGYVANVTETCEPENDLQLIVKVQTESNTANDDDLLVEAVPSLKERLDIDEIHTDGGYNSGESYQTLRDNQINHVQTALHGHSPQSKLGLAAFAVATSEQGEPTAVTCPNGQRVAVAVGKGQETYLAHFAAEKCAACPLQVDCPTVVLKRQPYRTLRFDCHAAEIARRRQRIAEDRQKGRNLRVAIESTIASLKAPYNYGQLPVRGKFRVNMVLLGCAAMVNVRRIHRYLTRKNTEAKVASDGKACQGLNWTSLLFRLSSLARFISLSSIKRCQLSAIS